MQHRSRLEVVEIATMYDLSTLYPPDELYLDTSRFAHHPLMTNAAVSDIVPRLEVMRGRWDPERRFASFALSRLL